ncbi:MAG: hypothetical protein M1822_009456 [Bathelium mastoideum]|nr:MAG: hypothetical protein M1822_009456 [Bathelium mastoideum]
MKAAPLLVSWHNENAPLYSAHFEKDGKGRLATAGGDNNVRKLWKVESNGEECKVTYLSTLVKHSQAVNVVRWCPRGEMLGSAGDDGNVLLWVPSENHQAGNNFGEDALDDKETWRVKHMCRSLGSEIYDMAWSPDGLFFITGSMDNIARIYNANTGQAVRQIAEHNHYVQGVAWDPLNEFVATQSSDRSVHIYTLKTKDGQFSLAQHGKVTKMDLPSRRISSNSPAPPDFGSRAQFISDGVAAAIGSPIPSAPGTPNSLALPMNPPPTSHSRRSSFGSTTASARRSVSPSPSMPLPAVMPQSPSMSGGLSSTGMVGGPGVKNTNIYANDDTFTSFFRRLTFAPDGSLLFTPAGQYKTSHPLATDAAKTSEDIINTVYIYTRAGLNKPPVAYLPGHKKPSIAVKCSPVYYTLRAGSLETKHITVDTSSAEEDIPALPEPVLPSKPPTSNSSMDPPPFTSAPSPSPSAAAAMSPKHTDRENSATPGPPAGPQPAFGLPYRIVYGVATQDAVYVYDTQQQKPLCIVSNLHYATFTDLTWSSDGSILLMTSSDGFCSALTFTSGELGQPYHGPIHTVPTTSHHRHSNSNSNTPAVNTATNNASASSTPTSHTPTQPSHPATAALARQTSNPGISAYPPPSFPAPAQAPSPSPSMFSAGSSAMQYPGANPRPSSPTRSMSASSIATQSSIALGGGSGILQTPDNAALSTAETLAHATPSMGKVPGVAVPGSGLPLVTPPQTPGQQAGLGLGSQGSITGTVSVPAPAPVVGKRESEQESENDMGARETKRRRVAPTPVGEAAGERGTGGQKS